MYDPMAVAALVISILAAIFVAIKEGIGLTLEYRESPETARRKEAIEKELRKQLGRELRDFLNYCDSKKEVNIGDEEVKEKVIELGRRTRYLALGKNLLEEMTRYSKSFMRYLGFLAITLFVTIVGSTYFWQFEILLGFLLILLYGGMAFGVALITFSNLRKYYYIRERFVSLHESPNLDQCELIVEEMIEKGIF